MDYKKLMGYGDKKKITKKQSKPKVNKILENIKEELNEWDDKTFRNAPKRWSSSDKGLTEYEKQLKQSFLSFLAINHSDVILARDNTKISINRYVELLNDAIKSDDKLKANFIMIKRYLEIKMTQLKLYMINLDDLEREINLVINN